MPIFAILIIFALAFYVFYKIKYFRTKRPAEKKWLASKSSIALGVFVFLFGVNQLFINQSTTTYIVSAIFIILGAINILGGRKAYKHYLPIAIQEAESLNKK
ncbi:YtpI family protein [Bacillus sp. 31A1R]|uniref:YtpI family protein n=1 Tax=Robertmurraya mangrovi TaxID=3098077 RepID=A0ABU5IZA3_9BACI|nr:YtpI family protein [Bacillus sp. 31A1R]MDZ5472499.1 YtpI family protein [Bacillus sp. 31A1R]